MVFLCWHQRYGVQLGRPTFVPVRDPEMGFEKIVKIAHARGGKTLTLGDELKCSISSCAYSVIW